MTGFHDNLLIRKNKYGKKNKRAKLKIPNYLERAIMQAKFNKINIFSPFNY